MICAQKMFDYSFFLPDFQYRKILPGTAKAHRPFSLQAFVLYTIGVTWYFFTYLTISRKNTVYPPTKELP